MSRERGDPAPDERTWFCQREAAFGVPILVSSPVSGLLVAPLVVGRTGESGLPAARAGGAVDSSNGALALEQAGDRAHLGTGKSTALCRGPRTPARARIAAL